MGNCWLKIYQLTFSSLSFRGLLLLSTRLPVGWAKIVFVHDGSLLSMTLTFRVSNLYEQSLNSAEKYLIPSTENVTENCHFINVILSKMEWNEKSPYKYVRRCWSQFFDWWFPEFQLLLHIEQHFFPNSYASGFRGAKLLFWFVCACTLLLFPVACRVRTFALSFLFPRTFSFASSFLFPAIFFLNQFRFQLLRVFQLGMDSCAAFVSKCVCEHCLVQPPHSPGFWSHSCLARRNNSTYCGAPMK